MNQQLINFIREEFYILLERKTGWGKLEVMRIFEQAVSNGTLRYLDLKEKPNAGE